MERENRGKEISPPSYMKRNDDTFPQEIPPTSQRLSFIRPSDFQQAYYARPSLTLSDLFRLNEFPNYG